MYGTPSHNANGNTRDRQGRLLTCESGLFRLDSRTAELHVASGDIDKPNGPAFSPDERILYVADSGASHDLEGPHHLRGGVLRELPMFFAVMGARASRQSGGPRSTRRAVSPGQRIG